MTGATLPAGSVTRSGAYSGTYEAWKAFDQNTGSMWISSVGAAPAWIAYEWADGPKTVTHYALNYANGSVTTRAPRAFTLEGWNGSAWVVVDTRANEINWGGFERREYPVATPGAHGKYRLKVTDDNDSRAGIEVVSLGGLELFNCQADVVPPPAPVLTGFTPASPSFQLQPSLTGTTEAAASVRVFTGAGCAGTPLTTVSAHATTGAFTAPVTAAANATALFSAKAVDAAGNVSACSATATYVHDNVAPPLPTFLPGIIPFSVPPFVAMARMQTELGVGVLLFTNAACTVPAPMSPEARAGTTGLAMMLLLPTQLNAQLFVSARDAAGNRSGCVAFQPGCEVGMGDCDGNPANGCEANLLSDEANCGTCGTTCGGAASANAVCGVGTCGLGCAVGTFDCDGNAANGCESATACAPSTCSVNPFQELLITDLSVVEDPVRTTGAGAWTFGTLMREMSGGMDPSPVVRAWLRTWEQPQVLGPTVIPPRPGIRDLVTDAWEARSGGPGQPLDFNTAPFRLLAIVNRIDLRQEGATAGEGRFVFGVLDPAGNPTPFTVIFEYVLQGGSPEEIQRWARDWHELSRLGIAHPDYRPKLQALTDRFTKAFVAPGRFMGSAISQVRTNENALDFEWELREFHFGPMGLTAAKVALTPELFLDNSPLLASYIQQNESAILAGTHDVPSMFQGQGFQAGSAITPFFFFFNAPGVNAEARHQFSVNTCNGCHSGETNTLFLHVGPRSAGQTAFLSPFLLSPSPMPDPTSPGPGRVFHDLGRRGEDLTALVCGEPPTLKATTDGFGEALLTPWRKDEARRPSLPGFPARSNLPAGRVH
ncbi:hypothetical protein [Corallococcus soli]